MKQILLFINLFVLVACSAESAADLSQAEIEGPAAEGTKIPTYVDPWDYDSEVDARDNFGANTMVYWDVSVNGKDVGEVVNDTGRVIVVGSIPQTYYRNSFDGKKFKALKVSDSQRGKIWVNDEHINADYKYMLVYSGVRKVYFVNELPAKP